MRRHIFNIKGTAALAAVLVCVLLTSCKGRTMENMTPAGDTVEVLAPSCRPIELRLDVIYDENGGQIETVNHAMMPFSFPSEQIFPTGTVIRKQV